MAKRSFRPEDALRLRTAVDPDLSPDGRRVAFAVAVADEQEDRLCSSIWVAALDGSTPARRFTEGPADRSPRWSPDGRWLAYISITDDQPERRSRAAGAARRRHAGAARRPAGSGRASSRGRRTRRESSSSAASGLPIGRRRARRSETRRASCEGSRRGSTASAGRRAGAICSSSTSRTDRTRQLTRGEYDHADPSFSPDGATIVFASDRHPRRDDRQFRGDAWVVPAGGRPAPPPHEREGPRRLPGVLSRREDDRVRGQETDEWNDDTHVFVVPADGSARGRADRARARSPDRPVPRSPRADVLDRRPRAADARRRPRLGQRCTGRASASGGAARSSAATSSSTAIAARPGRRAVAFTGSWPDRPSEVFATTTAGAEPAPLTRLNDDFLAERRARSGQRGRRSPVRTAPRSSTSRCCPPAAHRERLPLHVDIHGGPHAAGRPGAGSPSTRRSPPPATPWSCPIRAAARATARRSRAPAPGTGEEPTARTSSPAATT